MRFGVRFVRFSERERVPPGTSRQGQPTMSMGDPLGQPAVVFGSPFDSTKLGRPLSRSSPYLCVKQRP